MFSNDSKWTSLKEVFSFGNMERRHWAKSGEYIGYSNPDSLCAKNRFTQSVAQENALTTMQRIWSFSMNALLKFHILKVDSWLTVLKAQICNSYFLVYKWKQTSMVRTVGFGSPMFLGLGKWTGLLEWRLRVLFFCLTGRPRSRDKGTVVPVLTKYHAMKTCHLAVRH